MKTDYESFRKSLISQKINGEDVYNQWVQQMKGRSFFSMYADIREDGAKNLKLTVSDETLALIGYQH